MYTPLYTALSYAAKTKGPAQAQRTRLVSNHSQITLLSVANHALAWVKAMMETSFKKITYEYVGITLPVQQVRRRPVTGARERTMSLCMRLSQQRKRLAWLWQTPAALIHFADLWLCAILSHSICDCAISSRTGFIRLS